ncbi:MAG: hypothetical protein GX493_12715 [Firmicutes bacterium]|nr:hypothetical protein [Bacillota bacterium]
MDMIAGEFFITPHAVEQFRRRMAPWMSYEEALGTIIRELNTAGPLRPTRNGKAYYVRTKGEWCFRAVIGPGEGPQPAVITVLRGRKSKKAPLRTGDADGFPAKRKRT